MAGTVPLLPLLACCALTAAGAARIIREVDATRDLGVENKKSTAEADSPSQRGVENMDPSEVVTIADRRAQDHIVNSLQRRYPALHIVGEEGHVSGADAVDLTDDVVEAWIAGLPRTPAVELAASMALPLETTCVWVDPLDGTKEFACGRTHCCCVLIGVAVDGTPHAGVVLEPFRPAPDGSLRVPHIGVVGAGMLLQPGRLYEKPSGDPVLACGSSIPPEVEASLAALRATRPGLAVQQSGGCGNKLLRVLEGTCDGFLQGKGCCRWDTCAGEALLRACGGVLTDLNGRPYRYEEHGDFSNATGILAAATEALHRQLLPHCQGRFPA